MYRDKTSKGFFIVRLFRIYNQIHIIGNIEKEHMGPDGSNTGTKLS